MSAQDGIRVLVIGHDVEHDRDSCQSDADVYALVQRGVQLLFMSAHKFAGGLDQGAEGVAIQRFGVLFVAPHGPRPDQGWLGLTFFNHGHGPAVIVFIFDDLGGPAVAAPKAGFLNSRGFWAQCGKSL